MKKKKLTGEITLPPSATVAEDILYYAMMQGRDLKLSNCGGIVLPDNLTSFAKNAGYLISHDSDAIAMSRSSNPVDVDSAFPTSNSEDFFRKMLVLAHAEGDLSLAMPDDTGDDFETALILLRRMGFDYELIEGNGERVCRPTVSPTPTIKYRLPEKNYHLVQSLAAGVMASGCSVELTAGIEVDSSRWDSLPALGINFDSIKASDEQDELARRLSRIKSTKQSEFKYTLERKDNGETSEIALPGDYVLGLFVAGLVCMRKKSSATLLNLPDTGVVSSGFRMLAKLGADVVIRQSKREQPSSSIEVSVSSAKLTGKRIGGNAVRSCPEAFCVLASLGMIAEGKTVIRDLPFGSEAWRRRVSHVREILDSCGARVGEVEDGLVIESGNDLMMTRHFDTDDRLCELLQQMLSLSLPHHTDYNVPDHFENSQLFGLYNRLIG